MSLREWHKKVFGEQKDVEVINSFRPLLLARESSSKHPNHCLVHTAIMVRSTTVLAALLTSVLVDAARPFLDEPDTGKLEQYGNLTVDGPLPNITEIIGLPDFDWVARRHLNNTAYTYYRNGAAGEWSYRNNLEAFHRLRFRPRVMVDIDDIESSLPTKILGYGSSKHPQSID